MYMISLLKVATTYEEPKWYFLNSNKVCAEYVYESKIIEEPLFIVKMSVKEAKKAKLRGFLYEGLEASNLVIVMMTEELRQNSDRIPVNYFTELDELMNRTFNSNDKWF